MERYPPVKRKKHHKKKHVDLQSGAHRFFFFFAEEINQKGHREEPEEMSQVADPVPFSSQKTQQVCRDEHPPLDHNGNREECFIGNAKRFKEHRAANEPHQSPRSPDNKDILSQNVVVHPQGAEHRKNLRPEIDKHRFKETEPPFDNPRKNKNTEHVKEQMGKIPVDKPGCDQAGIITFQEVAIRCNQRQQMLRIRRHDMHHHKHAKINKNYEDRRC